MTTPPRRINADIVYESLLPWLREVQNLPRRIPMLGREFEVTHTGVELLSGRPMHINAKSVLIWYVKTDCRAAPAGTFTPLTGFSHGIFSSNNSGMQNQSVRISRAEFEQTAAALGGTIIDAKPGTARAFIPALPNVPVLLTYTEGDEEFPAAIDMKFTGNATEFLPFETLAVFGGLVRGEF
ncbi:MAG: DUF3786 domain-containing protein [Oscillospiraceae bacterium]|jgi:hypothetical protein|nr:DUF3786 domain-containing protein [Oscillospiraceae bacterium]